MGPSRRVVLAGLAALAAAPACGRLRFDPVALSGDGAVSPGDGRGTSDGGAGGDAAAVSNFIAAGTPAGSATGVPATLEIAVPSTVQAGDLMLLQIAHWQGTVAAPAGWGVAVPDYYDGYCNDSGMVVYYRQAGASEPASYQATCQDYCSAVIVDVRSISPTPFDAYGADGKTTETTVTCGTSVNPQLQAVPSVTALAGDVIVLLYADNNDATGAIGQSLPSGFAQMYSFTTADGGGQDILGGIMGPVAAGPDGAQPVTVVNETMYGWTGVQIALAPAP